MQISLKAARVNSGLSQKEVAVKVGSSEFSIGNWESGKTSIPAKFLLRMCNLYGIKMDDIILPE